MDGGSATAVPCGPVDVIAVDSDRVWDSWIEDVKPNTVCTVSSLNMPEY